ADDAIEPSRFIHYGHTANYNKIYFLGGVNRYNSTSAAFFTLEISNSLNITAPKSEQQILNHTLSNEALMAPRLDGLPELDIPQASIMNAIIDSSGSIYVFGIFTRLQPQLQPFIQPQSQPSIQSRSQPFIQPQSRPSIQPQTQSSFLPSSTTNIHSITNIHSP
ncbi:5117_t:CDS:2, partial [Ambispora gerdemannii]